MHDYWNCSNSALFKNNFIKYNVDAPNLAFLTILFQFGIQHKIIDQRLIQKRSITETTTRIEKFCYANSQELLSMSQRIIRWKKKINHKWFTRIGEAKFKRLLSEKSAGIIFKQSVRQALWLTLISRVETFMSIGENCNDICWKIITIRNPQRCGFLI